MKALVLLAVVMLCFGCQLVYAKVYSQPDNCDECTALFSKYDFLIKNNHFSSQIHAFNDCEQLCNELLNKTGDIAAHKTCKTICSSVGLKNFMSANSKSQQSPLMFCKMVGQCNNQGLGDAKILTVDIKPPLVTHGSTFQIIVTFQTENGTIDGNAHLKIDTFECPYPVLNWKGINAKSSGVYTVTWEYTALLDPNCHEKCQTWPLGVYKADIAICSGFCIGCGICSVYDETVKQFQVVQP